MFITDLSGKAIISRNYRGDIPLTTAIERFQKYLTEVNEESKKPVFHIDANGDIVLDEDVGTTGPGGNSYVYCQVCSSFMECVHFLRVSCVCCSILSIKIIVNKSMYLDRVLCRHGV